MKKSILVYILLNSFLFSNLLFSQQQWPMANGGSERQSWAKVEDQLYPPFDTILKLFPDYNDIRFNSLSILNNILIAAADKDPNTFYAFNLITRDTIWTFAIPGSAGSPEFTAAQNDTLAFLGGQHGSGLYCINIQSGALKWNNPVGSLYSRNPIIYDNEVYIQNNSLYCLDINTGDTIWTYPGSNQATPSIDSSNCYFSLGGDVFIFTKQSHEIIGYATSRPITASIALDDGNIYTTESNKVYATSKQNAIENWHYDLPGSTMNNSLGPLAIDDSVVIAVCTNSGGFPELHVIDKFTGDYIWHYTFEGNWVFSPTIANKVIYVIDYLNYSLYCFDRKTGNVLLIENSHEYYGQPVVSNHKIYVAGLYGNVYAMGSLQATSSIDNSSEMDEPEMLSIYPVPVHSSATLKIQVKENTNARIWIYNSIGELVDKIPQYYLVAGNNEIIYNAEKLEPGIYFIEINSSKDALKLNTSINKKILIKY